MSLSDNTNTSGGTWLRIGSTLETTEFLKTRLVLFVLVGAAALCAFLYILQRLEEHNATYKAAVLESAGGVESLELEEEVDGNTKTASSAATSSASATDYVQADKGESAEREPDSLYKPDSMATHRRQLSAAQKATIYAQVSVLMLLNYLLLVFLPGNAFLSFAAIGAVWVLTLQNYLRDEFRRGRYDRMTTMLALFFILAGSLCMVHYCRLGIAEGQVYQGPARIVGYDMSSFNNYAGEAVRFELEVEWGDSWGCPETSNTCNAVVPGALCDTEYVPEYEDDVVVEEEIEEEEGGRRRRLVSEQVLAEEEQAQEYGDTAVYGEGANVEARQDEAVDQDETEETQDEEVAAEEEEYEEELDEEYEEALIEDEEIIVEEANEEIDEYEEEYAEEIDEEYDEAVDAEYEYEEELSEETEAEEEEVNELAEEKAELEEENEELEEDLESEEEYADELANELYGGVNDDGQYAYNDDIYEDDYWNYDWDSAWGEFACEDLFDQDLDAISEDYHPDIPAGEDEWPTVIIYGSCNSCEASILDYYSTEHFVDIRMYEFQSIFYLNLGFIFLVVAAVYARKEQLRPTTEKEIVLLTNESGVPA